MSIIIETYAQHNHKRHKILADINMLIAFCYTFKDEIPPMFRQKPEYDENIQLKEEEHKYKVNK